MTTLLFRDLAPYPGDLTTEDDEWLGQLADIDPRDYRIAIDEDRDADDWLPLVERGRDGRWWAGRYIGSITFAGRRLVIEPRLGINVIEEWLDQAFGLATPPASARQAESEAFIVRLLARLWCRSVDNATRHGLPLLRLPRLHESLYVRGRLDVARTLELLGGGYPRIASVTHDRSLQHPLTRALVCAERALAQRLTETAEWRTERVRQVLPHLRAAVGSRPRLPHLDELSRVRYTPITLPFRRAALLSHRIASRLGYSATDETGDAEGILVDVAELWELFVLNCARQAAPTGTRVEHGTRAGRQDFLLQSEQVEQFMGRLLPDVLVLDRDSVVALVDAKYKRLVNSRERPYGVDTADLYQLAAYASRFKPTGIAALLYPLSDHVTETPPSTAERLGPWRSNDQRFLFRQLPTTSEQCREALAELLSPTGTSTSSASLLSGRSRERSSLAR